MEKNPGWERLNVESKLMPNVQKVDILQEIFKRM